MSIVNHVFVLLGGNIEPRMENIIKAKHELQMRLGSIKSESSIYETKAWGFNTDKKFLNVVLLMETSLSAELFLEEALKIEMNLGRQRDASEDYSSRPIDIDILYFNSEIINRKNLVVPHPRIHLRRFTLVPLVEISPNYVHPVFKKTNEELLASCDDKLDVKEFRV